PQLEYPPQINQQSEFSQQDSGLIVPVFQKDDDPINHMMSFLTTVVTSRYPTTNNQLRNSSNPRQQTTINNGREQVEAILENRGRLFATTAKGKVTCPDSDPNQREKGMIHDPDIPERQSTHTVITHNAAYQADDLDAYDSDCDELNSAKDALLKHKDNIMLEKKKQVDTTPIDYAALNQLYKDFPTRFVPQTELSAEQAFWSQNSMNSLEPTLSIRPTNVEVPKELPKVGMVNTTITEGS
ncbi:hypothetical protein Tco_0107233, partial [Tanacetum coccineum]